MPERLLAQPIAFAHRGARAHARENTLEAFTLAVRLGANGLESDVWLTADGEPVLDHDGVVNDTRRKRPISEVSRAELPAHIPSLAELYEAVGTDRAVSLDMKDPRAYDAVVSAARNAGGDAIANLWLCDSQWQRAATKRSSYPDVMLVDSTRLVRLTDGPERHAARLREAAIDVINMHHTDWNKGLVTLFHRFGLLAFGWDAQFARVITALLGYGIDAFYCDDPALAHDVLTNPLARA